MAVETLEQLRADVIRRWQAAFNRIAESNAKVEGAVETVFTQYPAFALENYSVKKFKPGARLAREPSRDGDGYCFRLDALGRPLHVSYSRRFDKLDWQGIYRYSASEVEQVEFCMQTGVPTFYNRLILDGPCILAEQRFLCGGGSSNLSADEKAKAILDGYHYQLFLTRWDVRDGVTRAAEEHYERGEQIEKPTREYTYAADGALQRIVQVWPDGGQRTLFAAKRKGPKASLKDLSEKLSNKIAEAILARLKATKFRSPLVALELSYHEGQQHIPQLIPLTTRDEVASLTLVTEIDSEHWLALSEEDFVPEITHFNERVEDSGNAGAVAKMLRATARRVTEAAPKALKVAPGFVAFPIDWELEGDELGKILKQCGATPAKLREWEKKGWL